MLTVDIKDKVVLVTGSNRGIGKSFVTKALELGAAKVYATARNTEGLADLAAANPDRVVQRGERAGPGVELVAMRALDALDAFLGEDAVEQGLARTRG